MNFNLLAHDAYAGLERIRYLGRRKLDNLYLATIQKAGSQWMSAIFGDPRMKAATGLVRMPQRHYEYGEHVSRFPKGCFVPGLYVSYQTFQNFIEKPKKYRVIYVYRDPRDLVISAYYSTLKTHEPTPPVARLRDRLKKMTRTEGIAYMIKYNDKFSVMRSWLELGTEDPNIIFIKFEDITSRPLENFRRILDHCGFAMSDDVLQDMLSDYTKENMRSRDLARREDKSESHYRFKSSTYRLEFTEEHHRLFADVTGDLIDVLGYPRSN
jgi:hypothetical protein